MERTFATLMARAGDEPDAMYGLAARAVRISADGLTYRFALRPEAHFHDGTHAHRARRRVLADDAEGEGPSDHHAAAARLRRRRGGGRRDRDRCASRTKRARDVPLFVAGLPIFSRAYYGKQPFDEIDARHSARLRPLQGRPLRGRPLHRIRARARTGGAPTCRSRAARTISTRCATNITATATSRFEGFTGKSYLFREEFTSRIWATRYDFPAIKDGRVKREVLPDDTPSGAQGWFINTRRDKFKNPKLREALICAFDFEWTNKTIMYGSYDRTHSVFQNSDMMATGKPGAEELALLEPFRGKVPDEVFGEPFVPPVSDGSGQDRALLRTRVAAAAGGGLRRSRTASA